MFCFLSVGRKFFFYGVKSQMNSIDNFFCNADVIHLYGSIYYVCCGGFGLEHTGRTFRKACVCALFQGQKPASFKRENDFMLSPNLYYL
ncbi:hypothetical protein RIR_jg5775.t1 [Rhizophagus irregularis DAOM 181602=DAOM 197198]|nr:hypothetical protein RIR_jg5775.t1 [Rhizophagus irregularis DAOM 181602=DAOM 197198]